MGIYIFFVQVITRNHPVIVESYFDVTDMSTIEEIKKEYSLYDDDSGQLNEERTVTLGTD